MRLLLVEDDPALGGAIRDYLTREAYVVDWATTLAAACASLSAEHGSVVLDLGLPDGDGLALLPLVRRQDEPAAVLILTARDRLSDRVRGLDAGADDYLVKPFDLPELSARLRAVARRRAGQSAPLIELGALSIDPAAREVRLDGVLLRLTAHEYALLMAFARHPRHVLTQRQLEEAIYALDGGAASNVVEVYVSRLRRKFGRDSIRTVRGIGYRWGTAEAVTDETEP
jgi:DNA-binding response OmpR family regulator